MATLALGLAATAAPASPAEEPQAMASPEALTRLARRHEHGEGVAKDLPRALDLYCRAAGKGYAPAAYALGWIYFNGRGGVRDDAKAAGWFERARALGDAHAKRLLVHLEGVEPAAVRCGEGYRSPWDRAPRPIVDQVLRLAPTFDLDPALVLAVIQVESAFDRHAVSKADAQGLMQLIPATAERFGVADPFDVEQNLKGGMAYLRWLLARFDANLTLALAGYNAGEGAVERHRGVPPYPETQAYVRRVLGLYRGAAQATGGPRLAAIP
ncbi:MAG: lytic transglycosylase domain-containing protein [Candidatus Competibacterales bacterium]